MDPLFALHGNSLTLGRHAGTRLRQLLAAHCQAGDIAYAALLEESGTVCADAGDDSLRDHGETAALAVGAFHAAREVARRLGETAFEGLAHEGSQRHFYLSPVNERFLLLSVFGNDTRLALVRACAARTAAQIRESMDPAWPAASAPAAPDRSTAPGPDTRLTEGDFLMTGDCFLPVA